MAERILKTWESKYKKVIIKSTKDKWLVEDINLTNGKETGSTINSFNSSKEAAEYFSERTSTLSEYFTNKGIGYSLSDNSSSRGIGSTGSSATGK